LAQQCGVLFSYKSKNLPSRPSYPKIAEVDFFKSAIFGSDWLSKNDCRSATFYDRETIFTWIERADSGLSGNVKLISVACKVREPDPFYDRTSDPKLNF
jgi:hypothetical protein